MLRHTPPHTNPLLLAMTLAQAHLNSWLSCSLDHLDGVNLSHTHIPQPPHLLSCIVCLIKYPDHLAVHVKERPVDVLRCNVMECGEMCMMGVGEMCMMGVGEMCMMGVGRCV